MKILLVGINAKFSHQNLALEYIKKYNSHREISVRDFNINQNIEDILREILEEKPDLVGFSVYIWNLDQVRRLTSDLKKVLAKTVVIWGGPEVSFDTRELLLENNGLDIIVSGEGEESSRELFDALEGGRTLRGLGGISFRQGEEIIINPPRDLIENLDTITSPFKDYQAPPGKLVYYEMSRGCPFKCAYCLSSTIKGVRYFSKDRIKEDLLALIQSGATTVKLVDRTFNANEKFSMEIMDFIVNHKREGLVFHMELMAHLINEDFLKFLKSLPKGLFQFEIGVQSANEKTLAEIRRKTDLERLKKNVTTIKSYGNIHQHVDLIVGLPHEDYDSFKRSFNFAYSLGAEKLQIGFLKLLRGSSLRARADDLGIIYSDFAPYEVLKTRWLSSDEISYLKVFEDVIEKFSNEDYFKNTLDYLVDPENAFDFFESLAKFWKEGKYHLLSHSRQSLYELLALYMRGSEDYDQVLEMLRLDYLQHNQGPAQDFLRPRPLDKRDYHDLLKEPSIRLAFDLGSDLSTKNLVKVFRFERIRLGDCDRVMGFYRGPGGIRTIDISEDYERIRYGIY